AGGRARVPRDQSGGRMGHARARPRLADFRCDRRRARRRAGEENVRALIVTRSDDNESVEMVTRALAARGARAFRFDTDLFPTDITLDVRLSGNDERVTFARDGDTLDASELAGVWHRRLNVAGALPKTMDPQLRHASVLESQRTFQGVLASLPCFVLDP